MNKVRVGLDLDGVISDIQSEIILRLKQDFDIDTDINQWKSHYVHEQFPGLPNGWIDKQFYDPAFWLNAKCYEDAWNMINKWFMQGADIFIITCRTNDHGPFTIEVTERWLFEWELPYNKLIHSQIKLEKYDIVKEHQLDFFVEDDDREAILLSRCTKSFLIDHPYNRNDSDRQYQRINSLREIDLMALKHKSVEVGQ
jgi:uncharacterized HAD superfamily protein